MSNYNNINELRFKAAAFDLLMERLEKDAVHIGYYRELINNSKLAHKHFVEKGKPIATTESYAYYKDTQIMELRLAYPASKAPIKKALLWEIANQLSS
jgi:hypothetical protein